MRGMEWRRRPKREIHLKKKVFFHLAGLLISHLLDAQSLGEEYNIAFYTLGNRYALPVESVDSIGLMKDNTSIDITCRNGKKCQMEGVDSICFGHQSSDTLFLTFGDGRVYIDNPRLDLIEAETLCCEVFIRLNGSTDMVVSAAGYCDDGRISILSDTIYTLRLCDLTLSSSHAPAINSRSKQKMIVELADGTTNTLHDGNQYSFADSTEKANSCLCSQGHIDFHGNGTLEIYGNHKHGIAADKGIRLIEGNISILSASADGINSDKYISLEGAKVNILGQKQDGIDATDNVNMSGGLVTIAVNGDTYKGIKSGASFTLSDGELHLLVEGNACKGIKTKGIISIEGGTLDAVATGDVLIEDGDPSYCSILKCDSSFYMSNGNIHLVSKGQGGKCISGDRNMTITGGFLYMETNGDGAQYVNRENLIDYYTPKCIAIDDTIRIIGGQLDCISTGLGGKGIVAGKYLSMGISQKMEGPIVNVETRGTCILDDVDEDKRYGCPKGVKANEQIDLYGGHINIHTIGQGGEGVECNGNMFITGGTLESNTYDDGINVGNYLSIENGHVYCNSVNNDGIDSNGAINISGGIVASVNQEEPNESFDVEERQFHISGGTIIGIGSRSVRMDKQEVPYYNTLYNVDPNKPARRGLRLTTGKYVYVMDGDKLLLSLKNDNRARRGFVTVSLPEFREKHSYTIYQGDEPVFSETELFGRKLFLRGEPTNKDYITDFQPMHNYND